ncbi:MAG TPA: hypothetical protein VN628_14295 [Vicinamibacterales bacterium]|nr:hypothetical protein [Vicinamibacterales bacterium]
MTEWWVVPIWKTVHYIAAALVVGAAGLVDLRIFGIAKGLPLRPLQRLMWWAAGAFVVAAVSGYALLRINSANSLGPPINIAFAAKMLFLVLIGLNDILYVTTGLKREVDAVAAGESTSVSARIVAGVSLALWVGVVYWSRMLTFLAGAI